MLPLPLILIFFIPLCKKQITLFSERRKKMKDTAKKIFQKLITVILIIAMLSSYFPMLVLANNEETESTQNYITFDVNWKNVDFTYC